MSDDVDVYVVTELDTAHAIRNTLGWLGCTYDELAEAHQTGDYPTVRHRMAWAALGPYYDERDHYAKLLETE